MEKCYRKNMHSQLKKSKENSTGDEDKEAAANPFDLSCKNSVCRRKSAKAECFYIGFFSLASCCLILKLLLYPHRAFNEGFGYEAELSGFLCSSVPNDSHETFNEGFGYESDLSDFLCSSVPNGNICCDRRRMRSDTCVMKGDVRTHSPSSSIFLYKSNHSEPIRHESIRPYTRKWEAKVMDSINELNLVMKKLDLPACEVLHNVPAVFFSTGGYTGNLYHEFNDGILPLYITSHHLDKKVVFVIQEFHNWWITKYRDVLSQLSDFPPIDFTGDKRVHCFPEAIVGLRIHNDLTIDSSRMTPNRTIMDFHSLLDRAYKPRIESLVKKKKRENSTRNETLAKPKLVIVSRNGSRAIMNEDLLVWSAEEIGFAVEVLKPKRTSELAVAYRAINSSDVVVGVHGAGLTHMLFMNPGSVFIQIVPLGTEWVSDTYFGVPARKMGLRYIEYKILPKESSLYHDYDKNDKILMNPESINGKGWEFTKRVYLDSQTVTLDLTRFRKRLLHAYSYSVGRKNEGRKLE